MRERFSQLATADLSNAVGKMFFSDDSDLDLDSDSGFGSVYSDDSDGAGVVDMDDDPEDLPMPSARGGRVNPLATSDSDVWPDSDVESKSVMVRSRGVGARGRRDDVLKVCAYLLTRDGIIPPLKIKCFNTDGLDVIDGHGHF